MEKIVNYSISRENIFEPVNDVYIFKIKTKKVRKLIKILLGKNIIEQYKQPLGRYKRVEIEYDKVIPLIRHMFNDIYYRTGDKPRTVIIGYDKMKELNVECYEEMRFSMPLQLDGMEGRKIFGLDINIRPDIDGLLLI